MNKFKYIIPLLLLLFINSACAKKKAEEQAKKDEEIILKYIADNNLTATKTSSGLYYVIETNGGGQNPTANSQVRVAYKGYFTTNEVFDESDESGIIFGLQQVIEGWTEGIPYFKEGGTGKLLIPSALAYGKNGTQGIPGNTVLIFDIHLIDVY